jgi:hypothetical protein
MEKITVKDGTILYWKKSLADFINEANVEPVELSPVIREVNGHDTLILNAEVRYTARGEKFLRTVSFFCNKEVTGDDRDDFEKLGTVTDGVLHYGIFMPANTSDKDMKLLEALETPSQFAEAIDGLSDAGYEALRKGCAKQWKIDSLTDGVNVFRPSGERIEFQAK